MKEKTDEEFEEELKQKMHDIGLENVHIYRDLSMGKWWYFFAAAFCLIWAISYVRDCKFNCVLSEIGM